MTRTASLVIGILVLLVSLRNAEPFPLDDLLEHGHPHEAGVVHADADDSHHQHGDEDDHHEAPGTPCHHHDSHSCAGHGSVILGTVDGAPASSVSWQRFVAADLFASSDVTSKKQFHVPLA
ncbi:MAG: hypothetical protein EHM91_07920 [Planctomycetota bacterium]|nr:MAG: hypothetical protein EHM91_07920 [Planctomycetota bacterium]